MHLPMELREVAKQAQNGRGECEMLHLTEETDTADENRKFRTGRRRPDCSAVGWLPWRLIAENGKCAAEQSSAIPDVVQRPNEISESHLRKENQHISRSASWYFVGGSMRDPQTTIHPPNEGLLQRLLAFTRECHCKRNKR
ncbi:hypothetical protein OIDMADRAFT_33111 [Oidiodendron maius Zn]|uniref:Uncharacterized protein n=1 Tax=Oidiodendron maius (strain Zn) TaxID=913774 RepID=A0A0C3CBZ7_OIDMZ|nr:hypothetical protein OIDMADRAFT_33111 [Oidiodendron maius Zn]